MRFEFANAYFFYGSRSVTLGDFLGLDAGAAEKFSAIDLPSVTEAPAEVTEIDADLIDVASLSEILAWRSGHTLTAEQVRARGKLKVTMAVADPIDGRVIAPAYLVYTGNGFNVSWKAVPEAPAKTHILTGVFKAANGKRVTHYFPITEVEATDPAARATAVTNATNYGFGRDWNIVNWSIKPASEMESAR